MRLLNAAICYNSFVKTVFVKRNAFTDFLGKIFQYNMAQLSSKYSFNVIVHNQTHYHITDLKCLSTGMILAEEEKI